ncbi:lysine N(6)-hydroxylase/L-ornithine N(5)-oxygenase family protein [Kribbella ginsengisoli]|uniref:L-lysine N6-monooxygenase MbtG n=1 Tax=Kribbella ginsengisoli TaxID=363865 RepID=A0ABP6YBQ0_9ACTN
MTVEADYDLVGVGIGPFNLGLAALTSDVADLRTAFFDEHHEFSWHPGIMVDGATLQVPALADLVSLVHPTSRWSFVNYLHCHDRLYAYSFWGSGNPLRVEYDDYCHWVARSLPSCRFESRVEAFCWDDDLAAFAIDVVCADGRHEVVTSRHVVVGIGTEPVMPQAMSSGQSRVFHSSDYIYRQADLASYRDISVVGSGQSGAEVFLDLLGRQPRHGWRLRWITRSPEFIPLAYSKLGLERFTPDYTRFFYSLQQDVKDRILPGQWKRYNAIDDDTLAAIYNLLYERTAAGRSSNVELCPGHEVVSLTEDADGCELTCRQVLQESDVLLRTDCVVAATGYKPRSPECMKPMIAKVELDSSDRFVVGLDHSLRLDAAVGGSVYVQNAEAHTHGLSAPDLGLGAYRNATIINAIVGRDVYRTPERSAFTVFAPPSSQVALSGQGTEAT